MGLGSWDMASLGMGWGEGYSLKGVGKLQDLVLRNLKSLLYLV